MAVSLHIRGMGRFIFKNDFSALQESASRYQN